MRSDTLAAQIEPFDSFWEAPVDIEKGYRTFHAFYKYNYLKYLPEDKDSRILVVSCGPGYLLNLLKDEGYRNAFGIDSDAGKISLAERRQLDCQRQRAFEYLDENWEKFDVIFCEQEINHLTKKEILEYLQLCRNSLRSGGMLIVHALNGANPITGAEALAQNFDHYNTFTEYTLRQVLEHSGFTNVIVFPLNLYVFYKNPLNYVLIGLSALYTLFFRISFILYGKSNKLFTKKIGGIAMKPMSGD